MTKDLSESAIRENCPHCDIKSHAFEYPLEETEHFLIVVDPHPIVPGHVLIIPKQHLLCVGEYSDALFDQFVMLDKKVTNFVQTYGPVSSFEHGVLGQTVFHSHIHYLPFEGSVLDIVPEGEDFLTSITGVSDLRPIYAKEHQYLYFSVAGKHYIVNASLAEPRFFRDRFAKALGHPERGNWKLMHVDKALAQTIDQICVSTQKQWHEFYS